MITSRAIYWLGNASLIAKVSLATVEIYGSSFRRVRGLRRGFASINGSILISKRCVVIVLL